MKKYILLLSAFCTLVFSGCYKEDPIHVDLGQYWRDYDVDSSDPAFKFISEYNANFGKHLLYDADTRDYLYNFQQKNAVKIESPTEKIYEKLMLLDELFLQAYTDQVKQQVLPYDLILAEKILYGTSSTPKDFFASTNFLAMKITDANLELDAAGKKALSTKMHKAFVLDYCVAMGRVGLSPKFYEVSADWYGKRDPDKTQQFGIEKAYEKGLLYLQSRWNDFQEAFLTDYASKDRDPGDYFDLLLSKTDEELAELRAKWPLVNEKAGYFIEMLESLGIDYKTLR